MAKSTKYRERPDEFLKELEQDQKDLVEQNRTVPHHLKVLYLDKDYWDKPLSGKVHWAGIDFSKFYPSINIGLFLENSKEYCREISQDPSLQALIGDFIHFPVDYREWQKDELEAIGLEKETKGSSWNSDGPVYRGLHSQCLSPWYRPEGKAVHLR